MWRLFMCKKLHELFFEVKKQGLERIWEKEIHYKNLKGREGGNLQFWNDMSWKYISKWVFLITYEQECEILTPLWVNLWGKRDIIKSCIDDF